MKTGKKFFFALVAVTAAASLTGCFRMGSLLGGGNSGSSTTQSIPTGSEGPTTAVLEASQTMATYSALTGATASSATKTAFTNNVGNLPVGGSTAQVSQPMLSGFATVAAGFCDDATTQNAAKIYPGVTFTGSGATASQFTGATLTNVENAMCQNFLHESPCSASEASALTTAAASCVSNVPALNSTANGKTVTAAVQTETAADCICTIVLASASALAH